MNHVSFDNGFEVSIVSLDILKKFDKERHEGSLIKLNKTSIFINLLKLPHDFSLFSKQLVVLK